MANSITIDVIFAAINKTGNVFGQVNKGLNGLTTNLWKINQAADLFGRATDALNRLGAPGKEFDYGLAEVSAIAGIAGSELEDLGKTARRVGKESGLGATGTLEAYKLLASQIDYDKIGMNGLNELMTRTITLSQTSKELGMAGAANALAATINQFGLKADQAGRIMNVLAAGSKYGAAEVPDLAQSFKVVGATAATAGLNVEQTAAAIEVLSKDAIKGSEAGTALRNILLKMSTKLGIDFKTTNVVDALSSLKDKVGDATYMTKVFGEENISAAQFLIQNTDLLKEYTQKVTGTSVATEQAAIMNQTWIHKADVFKAKLNDLAIGFSQNNAGLLNMATVGGQAVMTVTALSPIFGFLGKSIMGVGSLSVGAVSGIGTIVKATKLMNMALAGGKLSTYSALIERYGMAGRIAAAGIWLKNGAVTFGTFIGKLFNAETRKGMFLQMQQTIVSKAQAAWTWIVSKSQMVAAGITSLWGKRMILTSAIQTGWNGLMAVTGVALKGLWASFTGVIAQTWAWTAALWANPITWIVAGVIALVAVIALAWKHFAGFRGVLVGAWEGMKKFGEILFGTVLGGLKQLLNGIGAIGQAIALMFKGNFAEAGKTAMAGIGDIAKGALKMSPIGVAVETIKRKDEIGNAVSSGYKKGKAIDTSNFLYSSKKANPAIQQANLAGKIVNMNTSKPGVVKVPGMMDMQTPAMKQAKLQGKVVNMVMPNMGTIKIPGMMDMASPEFSMIKVPGMMDMQTPAMKQAKLQGKIVNMATPNPGTMKVPGMMDMANPEISMMKVPGMMDMQTPAMKQANLQGKIVNMATPNPGTVQVPGTMNMQPPVMDAITLTGKVVNLMMPNMGTVKVPGIMDMAKPKTTGAPMANAPAYQSPISNLEQLTKNITQNIATYQTTNQNTSNSQASKIEINYQPQIHVSAAMTKENQDNLMKLLREDKDALMKLINEELRKDGRLKYAG